ncbi:MAG: AEC family transporter [Oscillospiraceae bacterium]|nr:AEC family transporter [Oscillospiraceae bacterium]
MEFAALINKMVIFVVLMVIGYVCARRGFTDAAFTQITSKLVINVFMSATILKSVLDTESSMVLSDVLRALLFLSLTIAFCFVVGGAVTRLLRVDREHAAIFELLTALGNTMFIGVPVAQAVLGSLSVFYISLSNVAFNVILYTYGVWRLKGGGTGAAIRVRDMLSVPLIATTLSLLIFLLRIPLPQVLLELTSAMSGATMPLSMLVIGTSLGTVRLTDAFRNSQLYLASFVKLILGPALVALLGRFVISDRILLLTCVIIAACPGAVMASVLSIQYGKDYVYASEGVLQSTALSMLTIPALLYFFA